VKGKIGGMSEAGEWNKGVTHPLQSWEWGEFRSKRQEIDRQDGMLIVWTKVPFTPWVFGYIPMGKVPSDEEIKRLRDLGRERKAIGIRLEPNVRMENGEWRMENLRPGRPLFKKKTIILDLTKPEEELLKAMHPKGRYNIKVAKRHNVRVRVSVSDRDYAKYMDLMFGGTAQRQKIYAHEPKYHLQMWSVLQPAGMAKLFCAEYKDQIIACALIFCFKDTIYYAYGASALEHKEVMPQTLLLWEIMRWGKAHNYHYFDMWGAEEGKGFSRFKEQFGGEMMELVGTYDLPVNKIVYPLFRLAEEMRWKILRAVK
jgi:lipid II:glycine glycyltransferase (peptidoglycan interpeptide bridge formation enzyme)